MDNLDAIVGQRVEPALSGENTTLSTYVGSSRHHFLAIGDASYAPNITRFGLQATVAGAVRGFQASTALSPREKMLDAFAAARVAVENAKQENQYTSPTGAALTVAIVHPEGVCVGRLGGGRVHLFLRNQLHALFEGPGLSFVGGGTESPEISEHSTGLDPGDKVVLLSEPSYGGTLGQLPELVGRKAPQLAAVRVVEAARRRGQRESLAAMVLQIRLRDSHSGIEVEGGGGSTSRSERGLQEGYRSSIYGPPAKGAWSNLLVLLLAAFVGGGSVGLYHALAEQNASEEALRQTPETNVAAPIELDLPFPMELEPDAGQDLDDIAPEPPTETVQPAGDAEQIHAIFMQNDIREATRTLRRYARRRLRRNPNDPFVHLTNWVRANRTSHTITVLEEVLQTKLHFELRRWTGRMLADFARQAITPKEGTPDASPTP